MLIDLINGGAKIWPRALNMRQSEAVTVSLCFSPIMPSTTHGHFVLSHQETKMATQQSTSTNELKDFLLINDCLSSYAVPRNRDKLLKIYLTTIDHFKYLELAYHNYSNKRRP